MDFLWQGFNFYPNTYDYTVCFNISSYTHVHMRVCACVDYIVQTTNNKDHLFNTHFYIMSGDEIGSTGPLPSIPLRFDVQI